jgi:hypothetical protein
VAARTNQVQSLILVARRSMDMDLHSAGGATEHLSTGGTEQFSPMWLIGGGSLTKRYSSMRLFPTICRRQ